MKLIFKNMLSFVLIVYATFSLPLSAAGVCFHCEEIREYNRLHPQKYEYYEDYLEEQQQKAKDEQRGSDSDHLSNKI